MKKKLDEILYKLEINFPIFLKCFCKSACEVICKEDLQILLERNEIDYLEDLNSFIKTFLEKIGKRKLVIIIDDFDIAYDSKVIVRLLIELGVFLNHRDVIIIGAGDFENLYARLKGTLKEQLKLEQDYKNLERIVRSYIEKVFPFRNTVTIEPIDIYSLIENGIEVKWGENENARGTLKDFLRRHYTLRKIFDQRNEESIYILLDKKNIRTLVQILKFIDERVKILEKLTNQNNIDIYLKDILISNVFISLASSQKPYVNVLETDINVSIKAENENNETRIVVNEQNLRSLYHQVWKIFNSFYEFLNNLFNDGFNYFTWENQTEFSNDRFRFLRLVKSFNEDLYGALYIWLTEIFTYLGKYTFPLFLIVWNIIYGLPVVLFKLYGIEKAFSVKDYLKNVDLYDFVELDNSLNLIDYELRKAKVRDGYEDFILFGKVFRYRRSATLQFHFYRFFLNSFISILNLLGNLPDERKYKLIIDSYSYYDEDLEENQQQEEAWERWFNKVWRKYEEEIGCLREFYEELSKFFKLEPNSFDNVVFNLVLRSKDVVFREKK